MEEAKKDMGEVGVRDLEEDIETTRPVTQNFDERRRREEKKGGGKKEMVGGSEARSEADIGDKRLAR